MSHVVNTSIPCDVEQPKATRNLKRSSSLIIPASKYAVKMLRSPTNTSNSRTVISISRPDNWEIPESMKGTALAYE